MTPLHHLSVAEASRRIRAGALTALALTEHYLARIAATHDRLAAYVTVAGEAALAEARLADAEAAAGRWRGPLHGIPIAVKDVFATAGIRTTCHSRLLIDNVPAEDAACLARLKAAGAILIGKLATHEFAFGGPSHDLPFPPARNPWAPERVPGGSSSGSAVAVAAGLCAAALGSDTSGSIRMPAGNCGIVGLKPTYGRVSRRGLYPLSFSLDHVGPMAATVEDCALMLQALAGFDPADPGSADQAVPDFTAGFDAPLAGLRIGVARDWYEGAASRAMTAAMNGVLAVLRALGAVIVEVVLPDIADMNACGRIILLSEGYAIHKATLAASPEAYGRFTRDRMRLGAFIGAEHYIQAQRMRRALNRDMIAALRGCDVVVTANQYGPAERYAEATETFPFFGKPYLTFPFDVTGQPVISVPCGLADGLPLAVQVAGRAFDEATVLRVARAYEQARGDFPRPPD
ncbi:MAG: Asp-tRNA(Asn)/Glu-tRNA(Gln) amidotransferase subunit GatA [Rhizobiales bacterium]|nr:Asp-tRNA(Asn)/Glu-tRNA(Gln) amidotransferase subunit GatA [Hyphomicrobiales bacterium]